MRPIKLVIRATAVFAMLILTPLTISPTDGLKENEVCSAEHPGCVMELDSICTAGQKPVINYYNRSNR